MSTSQRIDSYNLKVYNRWGERIFESIDPLMGWDGTFKGDTVQDGMYTWLIVFKYGQEVIRKTGHVTLLK